ncbi:MAG: tol-pal system protein YbgF [Gemmatimonadetes bacterium]|uniref:Tol-pal system protein YbgF n=1 Tax=Candidatus Kutchimonas denitrificans TaxID=3056748 RepID=A0AAE4Z7J6_9BACT|nr:tol-pal system protein YbgF [Gemmatimonadota bacterium]NIR73912.1 tol-pal system protein YbgF [Candidatus Kutchimonas denitrificans]NIR99718.1 tol-pal system protein YbgF [Gemmatimonadota bacterium]NIT65303.1 tol-pal system protein YbgF [Gemmatimonadota bacterium]NIW73752.1 tol-pal system protein YbgF [Gemmatimonadota bacterium]
MNNEIGRLLLVLALAGTSACATKKDVDRLETGLASVRGQQAAIESRLEALESAVTAALEEQRSLSLQTRGDIRQQLDDMERQLVEIQELLGQSQIVLQNLRTRIDQRQESDAEFMEAVQDDEPSGAADTLPAAGPPSGGGGGVRDLYAAAIEQFRRGAYNTARAGFQELLETYPADELAPDAQYYLAETYREEEEARRAIREYRRVVELYPNSRTAPTALYKAGLLQVGQGNRDEACQFFQRILAGYPRSDESRLARDQVDRLGCR